MGQKAVQKTLDRFKPETSWQHGVFQSMAENENVQAEPCGCQQQNQNMRKIIDNKIVFDTEVKCEKCGALGAYDCTSTFLCANCMPAAPEWNQETLDRPFINTVVVTSQPKLQLALAATACSTDDAGIEELSDSLTDVLKAVWKHPKVRGTCTGEPNWAAIKYTIKEFARTMSR